MAKIQLPPKKEVKPLPGKTSNPVNDKKIRDVINKGGSITKPVEIQEEVFKNFNIKILETELQTINELREKRPKLPHKKRSGISTHDWIIEAIQEKIESERKKFKI